MLLLRFYRCALLRPTPLLLSGRTCVRYYRRVLTNEAEFWSHSAWDIPPSDDQDEIIAARLQKQRSAPVSEADRLKYNERPVQYWDTFYRKNSRNFFQDRKWLINEFPELMSATESNAGPITILEVGCGTGAAIFPLFSANNNPNLTLRVYDYSELAIKLVQEDPLYKAPPIGTIEAHVWDLTSEALAEGVEPESADIVIMVFVLHALHPNEWCRAVANVHKILKPNGLLLFRDYGRHDMAQLRFKGDRLLEDNFYLRGDDKTRVYFFELDELALLFTGAQTQSSKAEETQESPSPLESAETPPALRPSEDITVSGQSISTAERTSPPTFPTPGKLHPSLLTSPRPALFTAVQLRADRRLLLNRKTQVKMHRVWMQAKFKKRSQVGQKVNSDGG
ncbi:methyltransferase [Mycena metata]|uniref:tRNA N(3)-methylcytidine methyltransferase n=1 Tax=Mycena metata TaxID=1033252 RepID=A0AAD7NW18_9AGAR|nr:methyltransferase [Mycena metata]